MATVCTEPWVAGWRAIFVTVPEKMAPAALVSPRSPTEMGATGFGRDGEGGLAGGVGLVSGGLLTVSRTAEGNPKSGDGVARLTWPVTVGGSVNVKNKIASRLRQLLPGM